MVGSPPENWTAGVGHWPLVPQHLQHFDDFVEARLIDVAGCVGIGEADGALEVAAVGEVEHGQAGMREVKLAEPAFVRADLGVGDGWVLYTRAVVSEPLRPQVHVLVRPIDVHDLAMVRAFLLHHDLAILLEYRRWDDLPALGAEGLGRLRKPFL